MAQITGDWLPAVRAEFAKPYYRELYTFLQKEYRSGTIYPPADQIFNALHLTPLGKVKVVILGQDPYHNVHQAHGLCFSVPEDQKEIPPSLINIFRELHDDVGCKMPQTGCLTKWAQQGVLLLNTVLTVRAHQANSHRGHGWDHTGGGGAGQADRIYALGLPCADQVGNGDKSQTSGPQGAASQSAVSLQRIFRLQAFQPVQ